MNATSLALRMPEPAAPAVTVHAVGRDDADTLLALCDEQLGHAPHPRQPGLLELHEALFETPLRAWAWLARVDGEAVGHAFVTVGFSLARRGYCLQIESLHVRDPWPAQAVEAALFAQVTALAERLGCVQLQWTAPSPEAHRFGVDAARQDCVRCVLPIPASAG